MADIAFRSLSTGTDSSFSSASTTATLPTGALQADLGFIVYVSYITSASPSPTHTTPSGWVQRESDAFLIAGSFAARISIYDRILPSSPSGVTLTSSTNVGHGWRFIAYDNPNTSSHLDVKTRRAVTSAGTNFDPTGLTTAEANELLIGVALDNLASRTFTSSLLTERDDAGGLWIGDDIQASAGATPTVDVTSSLSAEGFTYLLAYKSEAAAADTLFSQACM
jgi:hypothetical protein